MRLSATDVQSVYPVLLQYTVYILLIYAIVNDFYKMYAYIICLLKGRWRNMHIMFILIHKYIYIYIHLVYFLFGILPYYSPMDSSSFCRQDCAGIG